MVTHSGPKVRDHKKTRVGGRPPRLPHGTAKQVLEAADEVVTKEARTVVRLTLDELASRVGARQIDDVKAAGP